jgi:hypothetical protein
MEHLIQGKFFIDNLTDEKIDARIAELDLENLRKLVVEYNLNGDFPIDLSKYANDKIALIILLWQRDVVIPSYLNLTFGEPYDNIFASIATRDKLNFYDDDIEILSLKNSPIYTLLKYPNQLLGFIMAGLIIDEEKILLINKIFAELGIVTQNEIPGILNTLRSMLPIALVYFCIVGTIKHRVFVDSFEPSRYTAVNPDYPGNEMLYL